MVGHQDGEQPEHSWESWACCSGSCVALSSPLEICRGKKLTGTAKGTGKDCDHGWGWGDGGGSLSILSQLLSNWASGGRDPVPGAPHAGAWRCEEARRQDEASSHLPCKATSSQDHRSLPVSLFQHHRSWALKMGGSREPDNPKVKPPLHLPQMLRMRVSGTLR